METALQNRLALEFAAVEQGGWFDLSDRSFLELTGRDRASFLHNFCTNDIKRLAPGAGCEAFLTNVKGRILEHVLIWAGETALWIDGTPGYEEPIRQHLDRYLITEDVQLRSCSAERVLLWLCGAKAAELLRSITGEPIELEPLRRRACRLPSGEALQIRRFDLAGIPGYQITAPRDAQAALEATLTAAGVVAGSPELLNALRIEAGWPRFGQDLSDDHLAQEARRTATAISFTKGCYLGQEPIARIDALGHVNRELCVLEGEPASSLPTGTAVSDTHGNVVGQLTSIAWHPRTGSPWGLAVLKRTASAEGTPVLLGEERQPAKVHAPPIIPTR